MDRLKEHLEMLVVEDRMDEAFTQALNPCRVELVVWLCRLVDKDMWTIQSKLSGAVLISLLQQLSLQLQEDTSLKLAWISCALLGINRVDVGVAPHVPGILDMVYRNVEATKDQLDIPLQNQAAMITHLIKQALMATNHSQ
jgi:septum formation topological specificity factor MinE